MKFSKSLLDNEEIKSRVFNNGVAKSKELLVNIFGLDIESTKSVVAILIDEDHYSYKIHFIFNERKIVASYGLEKTEVEIVREFLKITEKEEENISLGKSENTFESTIENAMTYLERRFELNFTPLDPEEKDIRIQELNSNLQYKTWTLKFIEDHHEGYVTADLIYSNKEQILKITNNKEHMIYLD